MVLPPIRTNTTHHHITLADGRRLSFAEFGQRQGKAVFYFHGFPGSRLEAMLADKIAKDSGVRFIGIDRPGFGLSDFKSARKLIDWPFDVSELADSLGADRFSILGVSGGGPYAAACACQIPNRLISVGIVCGLGPVDITGNMDQLVWSYRQGLRLAGTFPQTVTAVYPFLAFFFRHYPERMLSILSTKLTRPDRLALQKSALRKVLSCSFREAFRSSLRWPAADVVLYSRPWGFDLSDIRIAVHLWHGEMDKIVPAAMGHYLADTIPRCRATFYADEGHFSIFANRMHEIWRIF